MKYEFVSKREYTPVREELEKMIRLIQKEVKSKYTFQFNLIGSGSKKLITREVKSNKGFDFDYNFLIMKFKASDDAKDVRELFFEAIRKIATKNNYKVEDGRSAITIKLIDRNNRSITHSCDFAIIDEYIDSNDNYVQDIAVRDKKSNKPKYVWERKEESINYNYKLANIEAARLWHELKDEYLKLKNNNNDLNKKSYHLYLEAINNVYNNYEWI